MQTPPVPKKNALLPVCGVPMRRDVNQFLSFHVQTGGGSASWTMLNFLRNSAKQLRDIFRPNSPVDKSVVLEITDAEDAVDSEARDEREQQLALQNEIKNRAAK